MMEMMTKYDSLIEQAVCVHNHRIFKWEHEARRGDTPKVLLLNNPAYASDGAVDDDDDVAVVDDDDEAVDRTMQLVIPAAWVESAGHCGRS